MVKGPDGPWPEETLEGLGTHTSVADLELLINTRSGYTEVVKTLDSLHLLPKLKHLNLRFVVSRTPKKGSWPAYFAGSLDVHQLESLTVQSTNMPDYAPLVSACMPCMPALHHVPLSTLCPGCQDCHGYMGCSGRCQLTWSPHSAGRNKDAATHLFACLCTCLTLPVVSTRPPTTCPQHLLSRLQAKPRDGSSSKLRHLDLIIDQKVPGSQLPAFSAPSWLVDAAAAPATGLSGHQLDCLAAVPSLATLRCPIKGSGEAVGGRVSGVAGVEHSESAVAVAACCLPGWVPARQLSSCCE